MKDLKTIYSELLEVYTEQLKSSEVSASRFNECMFLYDEWLNNQYLRGICYEQKCVLMPNILEFLAAYELSASSNREELESSKIKSSFQEALDELLKDKIPLTKYFEKQVLDLIERENRLNRTIPRPPKRSNATRQISQYEIDKKKYDEELESIRRCEKEVSQRRSEYLKLISELKQQGFN